MHDDPNRIVSDAPDIPLGPQEPETIEVRRKMPGVVRFSRKTWTMIYVLGGVFLFAVLYAMGFFGNGHKSSMPSLATPPPVASLLTPAPITSPGEQTTNDLQIPSPPPASALTDQPPAAQTASASPRSQDELSRALAAASKQSTSAPLIPPATGTTSSLPPPVAVPEPGAPVASNTSPNPPDKNPSAREQSFYVGQSNVGQSNAEEGVGGATGTPAQPTAAAAAVGSTPEPGPSDRAALAQNQRTAFASDNQDNDGGYLTNTVHPAVSRCELWAGSILPAELDTGINSDLPGPVVAHVASDVYDSRNGTCLLIPKGSRLIGRYNSSISTGQARIQILWTELIWPDGRKLDLDGQPGADTEGNAGLFADVNDHRGRIITTTVITGLLAAAGQLAQGGQGALVTINPLTGQAIALQPSAASVIGSNLAQSAQQTGQQLIQQTNQQPPTLTVPKGERFNVLLDRSIALERYAPDRLTQ